MCDVTSPHSLSDFQLVGFSGSTGGVITAAQTNVMS